MTIIEAVLENVRSRVEEIMRPTNRHYGKVIDRSAKSIGSS